jgi:hypothetical protein
MRLPLASEAEFAAHILDEGVACFLRLVAFRNAVNRLFMTQKRQAGFRKASLSGWLAAGGLGPVSQVVRSRR